jgi:hypothetical protein
MTDRSSDAQHRLDPTCSEPIVIPLHSSFLYLRERPKGAKLRLSSSRSILLLARWNKGGEVAVDPAALRICILRGSKANEAALVLDHAVFSFLCNLDTDAFHVAFFAHRACEGAALVADLIDGTFRFVIRLAFFEWYHLFQTFILSISIEIQIGSWNWISCPGFGKRFAGVY